MSGTAEVFNATLRPTKEEIASQHGDITDLQGFYRIVDPAGEVGIEVYVGTDNDGELRQLPLSYRSAQNPDPRATDNPLTEVDHSELGQRLVSYAMADSVATEQWVRTIMTGDDGAAFSNGITPIFSIHGTGKSPAAHLSTITLSQGTFDIAKGTVSVDGEVKNFELHFRANPRTDEVDEKDTYSLIGVHRDSGDHYVLASLTVK